jgi:hypothetical protein
MKSIIILILTLILVSCTSSNSGVDKSTDYKTTDMKYGQDDWREVKDENKLLEKSAVMSTKPEKKETKDEKFIKDYMENLKKNLLLSYKEFEETPNKGWRPYFAIGDYFSAYKLIDEYIVTHKSTLKEEEIKKLTLHSNEIKALINK